MSIVDQNNFPKRLLVEGADDKFAVVGLMRAYVPSWSLGQKTWPLFVEDMKGVDLLLESGKISARLKDPALSVLGVVLDADQSAAGRYQRVRQLCLDLFPNLPETMPSTGLIVNNDDKRFGLWIMPDNVANGDLETFLRLLVPEDNADLWRHASESVDRAIDIGATCQGHETKARLYTWLAWQKAPGQSPGIALTAKVLDPASASAEPFVAWFKELYQLQ